MEGVSKRCMDEQPHRERPTCVTISEPPGIALNIEICHCFACHSGPETRFSSEGCEPKVAVDRTVWQTVMFSLA